MPPAVPRVNNYLERKEPQLTELLQSLVSECILAEADDPEAFILDRLQHRINNRPQAYKGFAENAYRLLFAYEEHFSPASPELRTALPSGIVETEGNPGLQLTPDAKCGKENCE